MAVSCIDMDISNLPKKKIRIFAVNSIRFFYIHICSLVDTQSAWKVSRYVGRFRLM